MVIFQVATVAFKKKRGQQLAMVASGSGPGGHERCQREGGTPWEWEVNVHWMFSIGKIPWNTQLTKHSGLPMFINIGCLVSTMKTVFLGYPIMNDS